MSFCTLTLVYFSVTVKGIQCHSNRSTQLYKLKKTKQQKKSCYLNVFFVIFISEVVVVTYNTFTQLNIHLYKAYLHLVNNEFSSKYCCLGLITMRNRY